VEVVVIERIRDDRAGSGDGFVAHSPFSVLRNDGIDILFQMF
jgi:hypothetical protein